jgi:ribosome biogenesis GTPase / thiamine phosphate phosphatase
LPSHRFIDGAALRVVQASFGAKGYVDHVRFIVRRLGAAILRVSQSQRALVLSTGKNSAWISVEGESLPRIAQLRRMTGKRFMPVPGDVVEVRLLDDGQALVDSIGPRRLTLKRRTSDGRAKTMAANVDLLVIVTALADPLPRLVTLDQLLAFAEFERLPAAVLFTKPDLGDPTERDALVAIYRRLGYATIVINPKRGENLEELRTMIRGHHAMLVGNSGVGKSTIFRALGGDSAIGEVSRYGLGRQTTAAARLYRLGDGFLIDSPGINEFGLGSAEPKELTRAFREMREAALHCRFADCSHLQEPDCAVQAEVAEGRIAQSRYASYRKILLEPRTL